jgi:hypothetical protein
LNLIILDCLLWKTDGGITYLDLITYFLSRPAGGGAQYLLPSGPINGKLDLKVLSEMSLTVCYVIQKGYREG